MSEFSATGRRCVCCNRWAGARSPGSQPDHVLVEDDAAKGLCTEGPWHGTPRGVRNACGQWVRWVVLDESPPAAAAGETQPRSRASS